MGDLKEIVGIFKFNRHYYNDKNNSNFNDVYSKNNFIMKQLELNQMENLQGGGWFSDACQGFAVASVIYEAGAAALLWNPLGQTAFAGMLAINAICLFS